jgi:O-antigen/teichoic acid export membrane protein
MRALAHTYRTFPFFAVPSAIANSLSANAPSLLMARYFSIQTLGQYALVQRAMAVPISLLSGSIGQVFFQEASESHKERGTFRGVFLRTLTRLLLLAVPIFGLVFVLAPELFAFVFGEPWRQAGTFARILTPLYAIRFIVVPLTFSIEVVNRNRLDFVANVVLLALTVATLVAAGTAEVDARTMLTMLCIAQGTFYLGYLAVMYRIVCEAAAGSLAGP